VSKDVGMLSKEANILCKYRNITQECKLKSEIFVHVHASLFEMYAMMAFMMAFSDDIKMLECCQKRPIYYVNIEI